MARESVGKDLLNLSFPGPFSHPHSRMLVREGGNCYSMLSVQRMKSPQQKARGKGGLRDLPRYLHIYVNQLLRGVCGGAPTQLLRKLGFVSFLF